MKLVTYLVWHSQNVPIASDECQLDQTEESLSVPDTATHNEIKEAFHIHLNEKYGEGYWKMEYFISITEVSAAEISRAVQDKKRHYMSIVDNG